MSFTSTPSDAYWQFQNRVKSFGDAGMRPLTLAEQQVGSNAVAPYSRPSLGGGGNTLTPYQIPIGNGPPQGAYSLAQTQAAQNMARATAAQNASWPFAMKKYTQPGMSQGTGTMAAALPDVMKATMQGEQEAGSIGLQHTATNAQMRLEAENANARNAIAYGGLNLSRIQNLLQMLMGGQYG